MMGPMRPEELRSLVNRYFTTVGLHYDEQSIFIPIAATEADDAFEKHFDELRKEMIPKGFIPMVIRDQGELGIYIARKPAAKYRSSRVNLVLLFITIGTTVFAGAVAWAPYENLDLFAPRTLLFGSIFFAFPLMLILGVHELSHYLAAKRHGVAASLPFFLPAFPPLGTFGAFISMRDPIPDRKALLDIGVSGPIAGFIMAIFVTITGVWLTDWFHIPVPADSGGLLYLGSPVLFDVIWRAVGPSGNYLMHPTAFAGWVGFLVTSLNLLPAGQLDGGHIARALFGDKSKYAGYAAVIILGILSMVSFNIDPATGALVIGQGYFGWIVFIFLILFLGLYHPPPLNDLTRLDKRRKGLGALAILILFIAFVPVPMIQGTPFYEVKLIAEDTSGNLYPNGSVNYTFTIENTGNVGADVKVSYRFYDDAGRDRGWTANVSSKKVFVPAAGYRELNLTVHAPPSAPMGGISVLNLTVQPDVSGTAKRSSDFTTRVGYVQLVSDKRGTVPIEVGAPAYRPLASFNLTLISLLEVNRTITYNLSVAGNASWLDWPAGNLSLELRYAENRTIGLNLTPPLDTPVNSNERFSVRVEEQGNASRFDELTLDAVMPAVHLLVVRTPEENLTRLELSRGDTATVPLVLEVLSNIASGDRDMANTTHYYSIAVRSSAWLEVGYEPEVLALQVNGTLTKYFTFTVLPDAPRGVLTATISFTRADPVYSDRSDIDFSVLVE